MAEDDKVEVRNVNAPDHVSRVDRAKYETMKTAMLSIMSSDPMTAAQIKEGVLPRLPAALFPEGKTAGWWLKCVQLDLEARGILQRHKTKPLTFSTT
ncbi:hypothetical protein EU805_00225 [Salipiger sp. IMCC34102]|uniref:DUF6958 family protein n=1 Tax=Salipiger sp. IMCC34102 TaxID=2510647 RepID=UPI00101B66A0|nr:hypothetical protein [Salipiger sp. IMCC34102]RYH03834.1 hypothetical protein EU805_00225 [Salipiger sp. IMCC34102]